MSKTRLDDIDFSIVAVLSENGRISNKDLAFLVGLSASACLDRVRRLERVGVILGYRATISDHFRPQQFEVWASIVALDLAEQAQNAFVALLRSTANIRSAFQTTGELDWLVHFMSTDELAWRRFCANLSALGIGRERLRFGVVARARSLVATNSPTMPIVQRQHKG